MTGGQFQHLIASTGCFQATHNVTMVFKNRNGNPYNVQSVWNRKNGAYYERLEISLYRLHGDRSVWVDFIFCGTNIYAPHKLDDLDFNLFVTEVDKFMSRNTQWQNWVKVNRRDYLLKEVLE